MGVIAPKPAVLRRDVKMGYTPDAPTRGSENITYSYKAMNINGRSVTGKVDACSPADAAIQIKRTGVFPIHIEKLEAEKVHEESNGSYSEKRRKSYYESFYDNSYKSYFSDTYVKFKKKCVDFRAKLVMGSRPKRDSAFSKWWQNFKKSWVQFWKEVKEGW